MTGEAAGDSSSPSWFLFLIFLGLSGSSFIIVSLLYRTLSQSQYMTVLMIRSAALFAYSHTWIVYCVFTVVLPVSPVVGLVNCKVRDLQVVSLPGTLVIGQVSPFDQVVVHSFLVHTEGKNQTAQRVHRSSRSHGLMSATTLMVFLAKPLN